MMSTSAPQGVSGAPRGRRANVDCVPFGAILRISPVRARLMIEIAGTVEDQALRRLQLGGVEGDHFLDGEGSEPAEPAESERAEISS